MKKQDNGFFARTEEKLMVASGAVLITLLVTHQYGVLPSDAEWVMLGVALTFMFLSIYTFIRDNC
jgi:uncharacterized membrane protein YecN with MAPEG domain